MYQAIVEAVWDTGGDVVESVTNVFTGAAEVLRLSDYADACPIATVALEVASLNEPLRVATAEVFEQWVTMATARLQEAGIAEPHARQVAFALLSLLEGAFVFARAMRTTEPVEAAGQAAVALVDRALTSPGAV
jgi:AcrR family transcriptional regulator